MLQNESALHGREAVLAYIRKIWSAMDGAIERGLATHGTLPGGLNVRRRALALYARMPDGRIRFAVWITSTPSRWPSTRRMPPVVTWRRPAVVRYYVPSRIWESLSSAPGIDRPETTARRNTSWFS
jgi:hypothetical protein